MHKKLTVTVEEDVYEGLHRVIGRQKISQFIDLMRPLGLIEISRTGVAAIGRGAEGM